jgi:HPt (histidine-containing phosphotransfer) domain-containing protein
MDQPVLDTSTFAELRSLAEESSPDCLSVMVRSFLTSLPHRLEAVGTAVNREDTSALAAAAHSLRGTSGLFGARRLMEISARLEECGWAGVCEGTPVLFAELQAEAVQVRLALEQEMA